MPKNDNGYSFQPDLMDKMYEDKKEEKRKAEKEAEKSRDDVHAERSEKKVWSRRSQRDFSNGKRSRNRRRPS